MKKPETIIDAIELFKLHMRLLGLNPPIRIQIDPKAFEQLIEDAHARYTHCLPPIHGKVIYSGIIIEPSTMGDMESRFKKLQEEFDKNILDLQGLWLLAAKI